MLELQNISYGVEQDGDSKNILRDISLTIDERFVAITGPNGGGKSTLAKVIAGILTPTQGRILLDGEDITGLDITQRAQKGISFAFQQPVRFKGLTVKDLITLASMLRIPVCMHNVPREKIYRPSMWDAFGTMDLEGADFRACAALGPIYGRA